MKKLKYLLCCLVIVSGCAPKNEPKENEQNKVVEPAANKDSQADKKEDQEMESEKEADDKPSDQGEPEDQTETNGSPDLKPVESEVTTPTDTPEPDNSEGEKEEAGIDLEALSAEIQKTDIFSMSMLFDNQQIADLYGNIGTDQFETAIVLKNMISPGGDETAIFKVKEGQMEAIKAGIEARDAYGKNEGSFYEMEQEMFNNSKIIEFGDIIVYIAARNVDEVADIVNQSLK